jgi:hypothetical protein
MSGWRGLQIDAPVTVARLHMTVLRAVLLRSSHLCAPINSRTKRIEMVAIGLAMDFPDALAGRSAIDSVDYGMTRHLADGVFVSAGANRDDVGVNELHDCFAANEVQYALTRN